MNKKNNIYFNTLKCLATRTSAGLKLDEIAKMSGIKTPSLYSFFKNKNDLVKKTTEWARNEYSLNPLKINIKLDIKDLLVSIYKHYIEVFSTETLKYYYIFLLKESINNKEMNKTYQNLMYEIETEISFVMSEKGKYEKYSNIIYHTFPSILYILITEGREAAGWEAERIVNTLA